MHGTFVTDHFQNHSSMQACAPKIIVDVADYSPQALLTFHMMNGPVHVVYAKIRDLAVVPSSLKWCIYNFSHKST